MTVDMGNHIFLCRQENIRNNKGQSTIEFLMSFIFTFVFLYFFITVALNAANGYLVHYATFMASRSYLVLDHNSNIPSGSDGLAKTEAEKVFEKYHVTEENGEFHVNSPEDVKYVYVGVYYKFTQRFTTSKLLGGLKKINLRSESFLGREPTRATCHERIKHTFDKISEEVGSEYVTYFDNGC